MIPFNKPPYTGEEDKYVLEAMRSSRLSGDGDFAKRCQTWFEDQLGAVKTLLTPSCTHALEMAAILIDIRPGDEVIMPSYTFVSTANAFVLRGAKIIFVDIRPDTMNIDETLIEAAITPKTKAIVPVHYAGVSCEMDAIMDIAARHKIFVIEDAAQGMMSTYKGRPLGSIGHLGVYSFHETKNYTSGGEGGLLIINDEQFVKRAEIIREKGTNRSQFFRGMVDKYSWVDIGSSFLPSEIQAAYLWGQLQRVEEINNDRCGTWHKYKNAFEPLMKRGLLELSRNSDEIRHNGHMFYIKSKNLEQRTYLLEQINLAGIQCVFHYVPLHSSPAGKLHSQFLSEDRYTTKESEKLFRLPLWFKMDEIEKEKIITVISMLFNKIENIENF